MARRPIGLIGALFAVALVLRLALSVHLGIQKDPGPASSDASDYCRYAWNLAQGNGFRGPEPGSGQDEVLSAYLPPGLPTLYALAFTVFGENYAVLRISQCVLGAATVILLFFLASTLFGDRAAWLAGIVFALYPSAIFYSHELLTETLYTFFLVLFILLCVGWFARRPSWGTASVCGFVLGLGILIRPTVTSFVPFLALWGFFVLQGWRGKSLILAMIAIAFAVVLPWSLRNYRLYHRFVLVSPTAWTVFIQGNNSVVATDPKYAGYCIWYTQVPGWEHEFDGLPQIDREPVARQLAIQWLTENKDKWGHLLRAKFIRFWSPFLHQSNRANRLLMLSSWGPVLVLFIPAAFMTLVRFWREQNPAILVHLLIFSTMLNALIYFGLPRYRYPMEPFCIVIASAGAIWLCDKMSRKEQTL